MSSGSSGINWGNDFLYYRMMIMVEGMAEWLLPVVVHDHREAGAL